MDIKGHRVNSWDDLKNPGDFFYTHSKNGQIWGMIEMCPCGCGETGGIHFAPGDGGDPGPKWNWDGNEEEPTLTPSILRTGGCKYHGFLTSGIWKAC